MYIFRLSIKGNSPFHSEDQFWFLSSLLNLSWEANQSLLCKFTFCRFFPEPKNCGRPEQPPNSTMIAENFNVGSAVEYSCDEGHLLVGPPSRVCLPTGFYNEFPPVCKRKSFALCKKTKRQTPLILSLATISTCKWFVSPRFHTEESSLTNSGIFTSRDLQLQILNRLTQVSIKYQ